MCKKTSMHKSTLSVSPSKATTVFAMTSVSSQIGPQQVSINKMDQFIYFSRASKWQDTILAHKADFSLHFLCQNHLPSSMLSIGKRPWIVLGDCIKDCYMAWGKTMSGDIKCIGNHRTEHKPVVTLFRL